MTNLIEAIQEQVGREFAAHHAYLALSLWANANGYVRSAAYFARSSSDEREHAIKWLSFLSDYHDAKIFVPAVSATEPDAVTLLDAFQTALELEILVTSAISQIGETANESADYATLSLINEFQAEQVQSVSELRGYVRALERAGSNEAAILQFDSTLK